MNTLDNRNPFSTWHIEDAIPFDKICPDDFIPAIDAGLSLARKRLDEIGAASSVPGFENTVEAIEALDELFVVPVKVFFNLHSADGTDEIQALAEPVSTRLARYNNDLYLHAGAFARLRTVHDQRESLAEEARRLTEKWYRAFVRNGASLDDAGKATMREIDQALAELGPQYSQNILAEVQDYELYVKEQDRLEGLPDHALSMAETEARRRGHTTGWSFTLQAPSLIPFLTYCRDRDLRETLYKAFVRRATKGDRSNQAACLEIVQLRHQRAQLLGYSDHIAYQLEDRMAGEESSVRTMLDGLRQASADAARKEMDVLSDFAASHGHEGALQAWDIALYAEKLKQNTFQFDQETLRPWFELERTVQGMFAIAGRLYGLQFAAKEGVPVWHEDVRTYDVTDEDGSYIGQLMLDMFPRPTKRAGAWMTSFVDQGLFQGAVRRPQVLLVCNCTPPVDGKPSLLSFQEVETLFHEFGHGLHGLLSQCTYRSLGGTNVAWDFVELPSQIMENWLREPEALSMFAHHIDDGSPIPDAYVNALKEERKFRAASACMRQLSFSYLDLAWHKGTLPDDLDVLQFEQAIMEPFRMVPSVEGACMSTSFSHIFDGGYSAGYYSYKWAEVLEADAFKTFQDAGGFDQETARRFRTCVLEVGDTVDAAVAYRNFQGRNAMLDALLEKEGLA